jgi:hypothetical protein
MAVREGERDLTGHPDLGPDQPAGEQGRQGGGHGHPGSRPVLRHGTGRDVHVHPAPQERGGVDAEPITVGAQVAQRDLRGLLHHLAQLTGQSLLVMGVRSG